MKTLFFTILFSLISISSFSQEKFFSLGAGYVFFGDGDYPGFNYFNAFQLSLNNTFFIKAGIQLANAAEMREEYYYTRNNLFTLSNNYNLGITPVKTSIFQLLLSAGGVWRYRTEISFQSSQTVYNAHGAPLQMIENNYIKSIDIGYDFDLTLRFRISKKFYTEAGGRFMGFNNGSGLYAIDIGFSYEL